MTDPDLTQFNGIYSQYVISSYTQIDGYYSIKLPVKITIGQI